MKLAFVELEAVEQKFFQKKFPKEELTFPESIAAVPEDTEILSTFIASQIDEAFLDAHPALRLIATRSGTYEHIDLESCARHGVAVHYVGSYGDHIVAEHVFALLLALTRRLREAMRLGEGAFYYEALRGMELRGKTFGILGAGRIGRATAELARAFGMKVIAHDIAPKTRCGAKFTYVDFHELLRRSHVLSLHVPLNGRTFEILNRETLAKCRTGVLIINTARGQLIDTAALLEALQEGKVGGVGLDVIGEEAALRRTARGIVRDQIVARLHGEIPAGGTERGDEIARLMVVSKLLDLPNVVFTPHIAFNCKESIRRIQDATAAAIQTFIKEHRTRPAGMTAAEKAG